MRVCDGRSRLGWKRSALITALISGPDTGSSVSAGSAFQGSLPELYRSGALRLAEHNGALSGLDAREEALC